MFSLFRAARTKVEVIKTDTPTTQHGTVFVRDSMGELKKMGLSADRPEVLADADAETIMDIFEQLGRQGYIPHSLEIATLGTHSSHDAPHSARVLEKLQFNV